MESLGESCIFGIAVLVLSSYPYYKLGFQTAQVCVYSALSGIAVTAIAVLLFFGRNILRCFSLSDKPRILSYKQMRRMAEHLRPYSRYGEKNYPDQIITMSYHRGVEDAKVLGEGIRDTIHEVKWAVDVEDTELVEPRHSKGLWLYGKGLLDAINPPPSDLLQDAFKVGGMRLHVDFQDPSPGINLVIGENEDKCFMDVILHGRK